MYCSTSHAAYLVFHVYHSSHVVYLVFHMYHSSLHVAYFTYNSISYNIWFVLTVNMIYKLCRVSLFSCLHAYKCNKSFLPFTSSLISLLLWLKTYSILNSIPTACCFTSLLPNFNQKVSLLITKVKFTYNKRMTWMHLNKNLGILIFIIHKKTINNSFASEKTF